MGIVSKNVRPVKISWICEECGEEVLPTGLATMSQPPQFEHKCKNDHRVLLDMQYPMIDFVEIEGSRQSE